MAVNIHHNTLKKAAKYGIVLSVVENDIVATHEGVELVSGLQANKVLDKAIEQLNGGASQVALIAAGHTATTKKLAKKPAKSRRVREEEEEGEDEELGEEANDEADAAEGEGDDESDAEQGKSIVKRKYKQEYRPYQQTCGDEFSQLMSSATRYINDGRERTDEKKLMRLAKRNGVWKDSYAALNIGQRRMTIGVRLRAMVKRGEEIKWD